MKSPRCIASSGRTNRSLRRNVGNPEGFAGGHLILSPQKRIHMPYLGIGLHVIVAIYFAVHAVRSRQNIYWLLLLFAFPMLGSLVYFSATSLPSLRQSPGARVATRAISQLVDPNRVIREARSDFDRAPTVEHRM